MVASDQRNIYNEPLFQKAQHVEYLGFECCVPPSELRISPTSPDLTFSRLVKYFLVCHSVLETKEAFVTLATSDAYIMGSLVVGKCLRRHGTTRKLVVMVSPNISREAW